MQRREVARSSRILHDVLAGQRADHEARKLIANLDAIVIDRRRHRRAPACVQGHATLGLGGNSISTQRDIATFSPR